NRVPNNGDTDDGQQNSVAAGGKHLDARARCPTSVDRYRNALGLDTRLLGDLNFEHTIGAARLDPLGMCRFRECETAQERSSEAFNVFETVSFRILPRASLATDDQCA